MKLVPDYYFDTFDLCTADFLQAIGVKGIILDVDNTLEPYENPLPSDKVLIWLDSLKSAGIGAAIVSNNNGERINLFNSDIKLPAYYKAGKPFKKNLVRAMSDLGTDKTNTVMMGDQILTDVWAARNAGVRAILVPPIKDKRDLFTRFKRFLERPIMRKYRRTAGKK